MGIFSKIFPKHSEEYRAIELSLKTQKKLMEKILKDTIELDDELWGMETLNYDFSKNTELIPLLLKDREDIIINIELILKERKKINSHLELYLKYNYDKGKGLNPLYGLSEKLIKEYISNAGLFLSVAKKQIIPILEEIYFIKNDTHLSEATVADFHGLIKNYSNVEQKLKVASKKYYHSLVKLKLLAERYDQIKNGNIIDKMD